LGAEVGCHILKFGYGTLFATILQTNIGLEHVLFGVLLQQLLVVKDNPAVLLFPLDAFTAYWAFTAPSVWPS
jgi:hypothetical protein